MLSIKYLNTGKQRNQFSYISIFFVLYILISLLSGCRVPTDLKNVLNKKKSNSSELESTATTKLEINLLDRLENLEVKENDIKTQFYVEDTVKEIKALIPEGRPIEWIVWYLTQSVKGTNYVVEDSYFNRRKKYCTVLFDSKKNNELKIQLIIKKSNRYMSNSGRIAIIIDGFDFQADQTTIDILSFPKPLTISLPPFRKKSSWTAQIAEEYNKEVVIQLAMEPKYFSNSMKNDRQNMIMVHYTAEKIAKIIQKATKAIPIFSGFTNKYGDRILQDSRVTNIILDEINKKHGYILESHKNRNTILKKLAENKGVPYASVTKALTGDSTSIIEQQLDRFCSVAHKTGAVILSTKATPEFVKALRKYEDKFEEQGINLVYISDLVEKNSK